MKKILSVFIVSLTCWLNTNAQTVVIHNQNIQSNASQQETDPSAKGRTVDLAAATSRAWERGGAHKWLALYLSGKVSYSYQNSRGDTVEEKEGTHYLDNRNIIHITWNNGLQEIATISYSPYGKAIISYNGNTYYESYAE